MKFCKICDRKFEPINNRQEYCSNSCKEIHKKQYRKKHNKKVNYNRVCPNCNNEFTAKIHNQKYCSKKCSQEYTLEYRKKKSHEYYKQNHTYFNEIKNCEVCRKQFKANNSLHINCSDKCRDIAAKNYREENKEELQKKIRDRYWKLNPRIDHPCLVCGTLIKSRNNKKYCSKKCHYISRTDWRKEYKELNRDKLLEYSKKYYAENIEEKRIYSKYWTSKNRAKVRAYARKSRQKHRDKRIEENRRWKLANKEAVERYSKLYRILFKDKIKLSQQKWREKNKDYINQKRKEYRSKYEECWTEYIGTFRCPQCNEVGSAAIRHTHNIKTGNNSCNVGFTHTDYNHNYSHYCYIGLCNEEGKLLKEVTNK